MKTKTLIATLRLTAVSALALVITDSAKADQYYQTTAYDYGYTPNNGYNTYWTDSQYNSTWSSYTTTSTQVTTSSDRSNTYPVGQCTWGAKTLAPWAGNYWGNAGDWAASAVAAGFSVGTTPQVGALIVWTDGSYGHVAYVTDVAADGQIQVLESNYNGNMTIGNYRGWFNPLARTTPGIVSYIYPNA